jgi:hypothetical protein
MRFDVKVSDKMTTFKEFEIIRIPKELRASLGLNVGEYINMETKVGPALRLKVEWANREEAEACETKAYISQEVYNNLLLENEVQSNYVVTPVDTITLGTDPEYFLVNRITGDMVSPHRFFQKYGQIGLDGMLGEIRPSPNKDEKEVVNNIAYLLRQVKAIIDKHPTLGKDTAIFAASHYKGYTAGFHLHYGLPDILLGMDYPRKPILEQIVRALDYYVGIPSVIPEGLEDSSRRCAPFCSYGKVGDHRVSNYTLEYRVPGGSLLRHPKLTRGLLGLGALVVEDIVSRIKTATNGFKDLKSIANQTTLNDIYPNVLDNESLFSAVNVPHVTSAKLHLKTIYDDLSKMIGYGKRRDSIEEFFDNIERPFDSLIEENWKLNKAIHTGESNACI